jgi:ribosomal protein S18 acetylase RimI-like enzyme
MPDLYYETLDGRRPDLVTPDVTRDLNVLMTELTSRAKPLTALAIAQKALKNPIFLARDRSRGQRVVGMATLVVMDQLVGLHGSVQDVVVSEQYRGQGISKVLMRNLHEKAAELGIEQLELTSRPSREAANKLYASIGYRLVDTNVYRFDLTMGVWRPSGT